MIFTVSFCFRLTVSHPSEPREDLMAYLFIFDLIYALKNVYHNVAQKLWIDLPIWHIKLPIFIFCASFVMQCIKNYKDHF